MSLRQNRWPNAESAFPTQHKELLKNAVDPGDAIARFDLVRAMTYPERDRVWERIKAAAAGPSIRGSSYHPRDLFSQGESERQGRG